MNKLFRHFLIVLIPMLSLMAVSCDDDTEDILAPDITAVSPIEALPGATVTITGKNLANASSIMFGSTEATATNNTATSITTTVPASVAVGSQQIKVVTAGGSDTFAFTVLEEGDPEPEPATITAVNPVTGGVNTLVTITGTNFTGATSVRIGETEISGFQINDTGNEISFTVPDNATAENFTGTFTVVTPAGTVTSAEDVMFTFEEVDAGEMSVALTADDAYVISGFGESILLTANVTGNNVARVVFMEGETELATQTEGPFTFQYEVGDDAAAYTNFTIMTRAYDANDNMVESEAVVIRVGERFAIGSGTLTGRIETEPEHPDVERWNTINPAESPELVTPPYPEDGRYPGFLNWNGDGDLEAASGVNLPVSVPEAGQYLVSMGLASGWEADESFLNLFFDANVENAQRTPAVASTGWEAFDDYLIENPYELEAGDHVAKVRAGGNYVHPYYVDLFKF